jgi:predicted naringenin-chalcone synthase
LAEILSIATAVPAYCHQQSSILQFMQEIYGLEKDEQRKLKFLYEHSGIETRYSAVPDYSEAFNEHTFIPLSQQDPFPNLEKRMELFENTALAISIEAIEKCTKEIITHEQITHLITVSCTGLSAPGLDLHLVKALKLKPTIFRTSINFMGCYAAIHALKIAKMICDSTPNANVVVVCTELCTLHFQQSFSPDNAASSLLFSDGAAAMLISNYMHTPESLIINGFYAYIAEKGASDMAWQLSSQGFLMTLSGYIPQLIGEDISTLVDQALQNHGVAKKDISHWCIHPGGKRILDVIGQKLGLTEKDLYYSRDILRRYGNMSSPTVLFVLKELMYQNEVTAKRILGMAFGPGLTMETFIASKA